MITIKNYIRAGSLQEAYDLNQSRQNRVIGGMLWVKMANINVNTAIDLSDLGLDTITETDSEFSIGAMVSLRQIELHEGLNKYTNYAIKKSVGDIVGVQFRNMATVGGSIFGRFGFSDVLTMFLTLDCDVELFKGGIISLEEFSKMERDNDILVRLIVKKTPGNFVYDSMRITKTDFPVIACGVSCVNNEYRFSVGARPAKAMLLRDEEGILSNGITEDSISAISKWVAEHTPTQSNSRGSAQYRTHLIEVLIKRNLLKLRGEISGNSNNFE